MHASESGIQHRAQTWDQLLASCVTKLKCAANAASITNSHTAWFDVNGLQIELVNVLQSALQLVNSLRHAGTNVPKSFL